MYVPTCRAPTNGHSELIEESVSGEDRVCQGSGAEGPGYDQPALPGLSRFGKVAPSRSVVSPGRASSCVARGFNPHRYPHLPTRLRLDAGLKPSAHRG